MQCYILGFLNANIMKTAMQELIQEIIDSKERGEIIVNYDLFCAEFLEKEKQQIIDAYCNAEDKSEFFEYEHRYGREYLTSEDYYTQTFGDNTEAE